MSIYFLFITIISFHDISAAPGDSTEAISYFDVTAENPVDSVYAFDQRVILWNTNDWVDHSFLPLEDTLRIIDPAEQIPDGCIPAGICFEFINNNQSPVFNIGLIANETLVNDYGLDRILIYRLGGNGWEADRSTQRDPEKNLLWIEDNHISDPFVPAIDTIAPVITFLSDLSAPVVDGFTDTFIIADNLPNVQWTYIGARGANAPIALEEGMTSSILDTIIVSVAARNANRDNGFRGTLLVSDGPNEISIDISRQAWRAESDPFALYSDGWVPAWSTAILDIPDAGTLLFPDQNYDSAGVYLTRWIGTEENDAGWIEYDDALAPWFDFIPGRTSWLYSSERKVFNLGAGVTTPLKEPYMITCAPGEFTDCTLPFRFSVMIEDILSTTAEINEIDLETLQQSIAFYQWIRPDNSWDFRLNNLDAGPGDSLNFYTPNMVFNNLDEPLELYIPPIPIEMSEATREEADPWISDEQYLLRIDATAGGSLAGLQVAYYRNAFGDHPLYPSLPTMYRYSTAVHILEYEPYRFELEMANDFKSSEKFEIAFVGNLPPDSELWYFNPDSVDWLNVALDDTISLRVPGNGSALREFVVDDTKPDVSIQSNLSLLSKKVQAPQILRSAKGLQITVPKHFPSAQITVMDLQGKTVFTETVGPGAACMPQLGIGTWLVRVQSIADKNEAVLLKQKVTVIR